MQNALVFLDKLTPADAALVGTQCPAAGHCSNSEWEGRSGLVLEQGSSEAVVVEGVGKTLDRPGKLASRNEAAVVGNRIGPDLGT